MKKTKIIAIVALFVIVLTVSVFAADWDKVTAVIRSGITVIMDGNVLTMKDANGNVVNPIVIDGTTYLPIRALSETLGKSVEWVGETETIILGELKKVNLISIVSKIYGYAGEIVKGSASLTFDNIGDTGVVYDTAVKIKDVNTAEKEVELTLNKKYKYLDCDVLFVPDDAKAKLAHFSIKDKDTDVSLLSGSVNVNEIKHFEKLDITNISKLEFTAKGNYINDDGTFYFLNPVVY